MDASNGGCRSPGQTPAGSLPVCLPGRKLRDIAWHQGNPCRQCIPCYLYMLYGKFKHPKKHDRSLKVPHRRQLSALSGHSFLKARQLSPFLHNCIRDKSNPVTGKSMFLMGKFIEGAVGKYYKAKRITSGEMLVKVNSEAHERTH